MERILVIDDDKGILDFVSKSSNIQVMKWKLLMTEKRE